MVGEGLWKHMSRSLYGLNPKESHGTTGANYQQVLVRQNAMIERTKAYYITTNGETYWEYKVGCHDHYTTTFSLFICCAKCGGESSIKSGNTAKKKLTCKHSPQWSWWESITPNLMCLISKNIADEGMNTMPEHSIRKHPIAVSTPAC